MAVLERAHPTARLAVVELDDGEFDVRLPGPVKRLRNAGADAYPTADSLDDLASQLRSAQHAPPPADRAPDEDGTSRCPAVRAGDLRDDGVGVAAAGDGRVA